VRVLLVDDNEHSLQGLSVVLADLGHQPVAVSSAEAALERVRADYYPLVVTDIRMPGIDGLDLLARLKDGEESRHSDVVIITGHGDMETAIDALRKGAYDYLNKPINARELAAVVERSAEHQALLHENRDFRERFSRKVREATSELRRDLERARSRLRRVVGVGDVVAESAAMRTLVRETELYHGEPGVPVLIEGETGTGKEILARLVHHGPPRGTDGEDTPFVALNCSAISPQLFESELFGHEAGAYTGSTRTGARGKLELAGQGTLFLDEVAEMPLELQPKLLRVLEERTFYRVGGLKKREFQARVVCASNRGLETMVAEGRFRRDLFHRLKVGHLVLPPLRQRPEDIPVLAETLELLLAQAWPGNVRELENAMERAVLTHNGEVLMPGHLDFLTREAATDRAVSAEPAATNAAAFLDPQRLVLPEEGLDLEALTTAVVLAAVERFDGNKTRAARYLGLSRYALHRRLQKNGE
jgi:DNA-binding NtrC family response regulator